ncbi:undecaprenyl/decaprenyl-phosphate alpha-N-acetylglucosaminyl 1-phosphate transferase [candidate division KSB1 bacterium]|nr:undecaprenyl/decaprenyl-phosphate alpha-N-acetylglucosaminyl 1-phosphate transferase [candidate division KSB1 bacterium]NIR72884.1 undecaprenyl/decaprenyl-phosphate alpha-N-acetylglucosaminyl 1-phosphate transferase [candidate division KSB1 bacterium]NIS25271.1 undecaprenyl/decaprenyl-phosphate alpha-N-acetylglucosaminyl 1-phosphate transferase [candidate division KSB1 bacterium]NIT72175.1 undecaprenyl/decaprenyl-phosphate alpha-N-acetylglucosaminyl 1-phosphate transferase [candidate division
MLATLISVFAALLISTTLTPTVRKLAYRFGIVAEPNHRTVHKHLTPKLGGLSIFAAFSIGVLILAILHPDNMNVLGIWLGSMVVLMLGFLDDIRGLGCYSKLSGQVLAASIALALGFKIKTIYLFSGHAIDLGVWGAPLTIFWIVGITNAVNLLDGLDGLASGFSVIVSGFALIAAAMIGNYEMVALTLVLSAALLGFLKYNFAPAKIFLGDTGSLFLGFTLACLSVNAFHFQNAGPDILAAAILFWLPLADTNIAIFRRLSKRQHPFRADQEHIHHRLLKLGLSQSSAVSSIYAVTFVCGSISLLLFAGSLKLGGLLLFGFAVLFVFALIHLGCFDFVRRKPVSGNLAAKKFQKRPLNTVTLEASVSEEEDGGGGGRQWQ